MQKTRLAHDAMGPSLQCREAGAAGMLLRRSRLKPRRSANGRGSGEVGGAEEYGFTDCLRLADRHGGPVAEGCHSMEGVIAAGS
jgi:hypothetical protein